MVILRCERFVIEKKIVDKERYSDYDCVRVSKVRFCCLIYDRVAKKEIIRVNTGNEELDKELAEAILTMLNIKYVGKGEEE